MTLPALLPTIQNLLVADLETRFIFALLLTWLIEIPALFLLARLVLRLPAVSNARLLASGLLASALTLPLLWFIWPRLFSASFSVCLGEGLVWLIEAGLYRWLIRVRLSQALLISLACNALSFLSGLALL